MRNLCQKEENLYVRRKAIRALTAYFTYAIFIMNEALAKEIFYEFILHFSIIPPELEIYLVRCFGMFLIASSEYLLSEFIPLLELSQKIYMESKSLESRTCILEYFAFSVSKMKLDEDCLDKCIPFFEESFRLRSEHNCEKAIIYLISVLRQRVYPCTLR